jgi:hypothetical protein
MAFTYEINIDAPDAVVITSHPGHLVRVVAGSATEVSGRQEADHTDRSQLYVAQPPDPTGAVTRMQLQGHATTSARDALLWASELAFASGGRLPLEVHHDVIVAALEGR